MPYDAEATRQRIFTAAVAEFAERGTAGARVDRIAARAKANKQAIYAYFGDKERLFRLVLKGTKAQLAEAVPVTTADLPGYAVRLLDYHRGHPEVLRLLLWEALELGADGAPDDSDRAAHYQDKTRMVRAAQQAGAVGTALDAPVLMFFTLGLTNLPFVLPQIARMLGAELPPERLADQLATAVRRLAEPDRNRGRSPDHEPGRPGGPPDTPGPARGHRPADQPGGEPDADDHRVR